MRIRINETSPAATDELSEPTGPQLLAANMKRGFKTLGDAASSAATGESGAGELTGPQILAMNMKRGFGADAKKADPWGPPWGHRVPAKEKTAPAAPAGSSAGASPAANGPEDELAPHVIAKRKAEAAQVAQMARAIPPKKVQPPGPVMMRLGPLSGDDQ